MSNKELIFCICYNCGKIANKCLETYHKFHDKKIHVFGKQEDFDEIANHENNVLVNIGEDKILADCYTKGHWGTAYVWAKVIQGEYGDYDRFIQIDSDVIFLDECLSDIHQAFDDGYDLIGSRRSYLKYRPMIDIVHTSFIGFTKHKITKDIPFDILQKMCGGHYTQYPIPINDFFDPISFDILFNGGKIHYLKQEDYGHCDEFGNFDNGFLPLNTWYDFGNKFLHFAGIGSGMNFHKNGYGDVPHTYAGWALHRYAMYMKLLYEEEIEVEELVPFNFNGADKDTVYKETRKVIHKYE